MERRDTNRNDGNGLAEETHLLLDVALELVAGCAGVRDVHDKLACGHMPLRGATCARLVAHRGDGAPLLAVTPPAPTATSTKRPIHHEGGMTGLLHKSVEEEEGRKVGIEKRKRERKEKKEAKRSFTPRTDGACASCLCVSCGGPCACACGGDGGGASGTMTSTQTHLCARYLAQILVVVAETASEEIPLVQVCVLGWVQVQVQQREECRKWP